MPTNAQNWNTRGSEWHRWDPHIHAPGTAMNDLFKGSWGEYLDALEKTTPQVQALGITDYCSIECYKAVVEQKANGRLPNVALIFPNVEFRLEIKTARGKGLNIHLLFSPDDPKHPQEIERILSHLSFEFRGRAYKCSKPELIQLGKEHDSKIKDDAVAFSAGVNLFKVNFPALRSLFRSETWLRENCVVAVAAAEGDGTSGLQDDDAFVALREEIQRFAHVMLTGKSADRDYWLGLKPDFDRAFIEEKYRALKPCLHGCDAHEVAKVGKPDQNRYCWVKGDLSFESIRQAIIEPEERIWIGEAPPQALSDFSVIEAIKPHGMPWLQNDKILLNSGLVAVIGARGSGKTALVDMIAAGAQALLIPLADSSFVQRATDPDDLIGDAKVEEIWRDGSSSNFAFAAVDPDGFDTGAAEVCYLSQQFVDRLCSSAGLAGPLRSEIERVIFDQTDKTRRYENESFQALANYLLGPIRRRRQQKTEAVDAASQKIAEEQRLNEHLPKLKRDREALDGVLVKERKQLTELIPKNKEAQAKRHSELETAATDAGTKIEELRRRIKALEELLEDAENVRDFEEPLRFKQAQERFDEAALTPQEWAAFHQKFEGDFTGVVTLAKTRVQREIKLLEEGDPDRAIDTTAPLSTWPLSKLKAELEKVRKELGVTAERQRKYDVLKRKIDGDALALKKLDASIKNAEGASQRRKAAMEQRKIAYGGVFDTFVEEEKTLKLLYEPLHGEFARAEGSLGKLKFSVIRRVDIKSWVSAGDALLDMRKDPFRAAGGLLEESTAKLLPVWRTGSSAEVSAELYAFAEKYGSDIVKAMPQSVPLDGVIAWKKKVGDWLFSTDHVTIEYGLEYDGIAIEKLSPGTRGIVLLLLYLGVDKADRRPLLIDQPEENLDPQSVFQDLVPHFREARKRRQVIIVTHNANLVVNTDADQVIVASAQPSQNGALPRISYASGSLENPAIRRSVCDILEGGKRAFLERERRYRLQWEQMLQEEEVPEKLDFLE